MYTPYPTLLKVLPIEHPIFDLMLCKHLLMALHVFTFGALMAPPSCTILVDVVLGEIKLYPLVTLLSPLRPLLSLDMGLVRWQGCANFYATEFICEL